MLTDDILNENERYAIPDSTLDNEVANLVKNLKAKGVTSDVEFDPKKHLITPKKPKSYTFDDFGIKKTHVRTMNPIAAIEPFDLLTQDAIDVIMLEIFADRELLKKYGRLVNLAKNSTSLDFQISGFIYATKFTQALFTSDEFIEIVNTVMEDDLIMTHEFHMGHLNVSLAKLGQEDEDIDYEELKRHQDENADEISSSVHWHYDSPPLVCVIMLAASDKMVGGETGVRLGDESILRIPNSKVGAATMLQARVIKHIATKPVNNYDRISYILAFIPRDPNRYDSTCATSERPGAVPSFTNDRFYPTFINYRFDRVEKRLQNFRSKIMKVREDGGKFDQRQAIDFIQDIETYLQQTYKDFEAISDEPYPPPLFSIPYKDLVGA